MSRGTAVVTGASSGIGAATARRLAAEGFDVVAVARRTERIESLAEEIGGRAITCVITDADDVAALAEQVRPSISLLVNNAGGAIGQDPIEDAKPDDWRRMFEINVVGTVQMLKALIPALEADGGGTVVDVTSTAARVAYEGGAGYTAAKHAAAVLTETLRLELAGRPVRVCEVAPEAGQAELLGVDHAGGDQEKADQVYAGVKDPLVADDIADVIAFVATRPPHVNIDLLVVKPIAQAAQHKIIRDAD